MKKITFLLLGLLMTTSASAVENEYVPLVREGVKWVYMTFHEPGYEQCVVPEQLYSFEIMGDTTILGKNYKHVYCTLLDKAFMPSSTPMVYTNIREEGKVVYESNSFYGYSFNTAILNKFKGTFPHGNYYPFWIDYIDDDRFVNTPEFVLYDFNRETYLPDLFNVLYDETIDDDDYYEYIIENVNELNNFYRKNPEQIRVKIGDNDRDAYIMNRYENYNFFTYFTECRVIEGIGVDSRSGDLISPQNNIALSDNELMGLVAVYEGDELIYKGCLYNEAMELTGYCDVNGDGAVTSADVTTLYDFLLGNTSELPNTYDVNGDGFVTAADITAIYNVILGEQ